MSTNENMFWKPSKNGHSGHEDLFVKNEQGQEFKMATIFPSNKDDPSKGHTLSKRDMNYGLGNKFIPQSDSKKEWNLMIGGAKDRGEHFANQQREMGHKLTTGQTPSHEVATQSTNSHTANPAEQGMER